MCLLDRTTREVMLTEAGQQLAARMAGLLEEVNTTLLDIRSYGEQRRGTHRRQSDHLGAPDAAVLGGQPAKLSRYQGHPA
ncbi:hypothetical protein [Candidatus Pantoea persica]|uniref:hypothetical protein n=1 Tax=Candidatus Pantoea persica TaxID=2518128 RepID=UPI0035A8BD57|nr:LysR family transcriptional regulator [Candidatus Pantoea persica]